MINDPTWSYGKSKLYTSSGATVVNGDDEWSYGKDTLYHEYIAPAAGGLVAHYYRNFLAGDKI